MDFIYRSEAPRYKGEGAASQPTSGGMFGWLGRMFGGAQPVYRRREVTAQPTTPTQAQAQGWWQPPKPQYAAAPAVSPAPDPTTVDSATCVCVVDPAPEPCECQQAAEAVPTEIHIW